MSEPPGNPEYYVPPTEPTPTPPPPPSISDAAEQWTLAQDGDAREVPYQAQAYETQPSPQAYAQQYQQNPAQPYGQQYGYAPPAAQPRTGQGLAVTALVLGIIALVTGWIPVWGVLLGLAAAIIGGIALAKKQSKGMAISGIVTGLLGLAFSALMVVVFVLSARGSSGDPDDWFSFSPAPSSEEALPTTPVSQGVSVAESAFGTASWDDTAVWYTVIVDNTSGVNYSSTELTVQALDDSGNVVDTGWSYTTLPTGQTALTGLFYDLNGAEVASVSVVGPAGGDFQESSVTGAATISGLTSVSDDFWTTATGTFTSTSSEPLNGPIITVVARDSSGAIIGYANGYLDTVEPGASAPFEAMFFEVMPEGTQYTAYWSAY